MGVPIGSSATFRGDGSVGFASAFAYWTAVSADGKPLMLADTGKNPARPVGCRSLSRVVMSVPTRRRA